MLAVSDIVVAMFLFVVFGYLTFWWSSLSQDSVSGRMAFTPNIGTLCSIFKAILTVNLNNNFDRWMLLSFHVEAATWFVIGLFSVHQIFIASGPTASQSASAAGFKFTDDGFCHHQTRQQSR